MVKVVDKGERACIVTLDGTETSITFQEAYRYFAVKNNSDEDINISLKRGFTPTDDGVIPVAAGSSVLFPHMKPNVNQLFVSGTGAIVVVATNEPVNPFRNAPAGSGNGRGGATEVTWELSSSYGLIDHVKVKSSTDGCGYIKDGISGRLALYKSYSSYNLTYTDPIDLTNIKKIIIKGATTANTSRLTTTAYCCISSEPLTVLDDTWSEMNKSVGAPTSSPSEFEFELDCSSIKGKAYINFAVLHGTEVASYTSYLHLYSISFTSPKTTPDVNIILDGEFAQTLIGEITTEE